MRIVKFRHLFDDKNAARIWFELERNQVLGFVVQLECRCNGEWIPVVRFDTHHGFAHRDLMHPSNQASKTEMAVRDYNEGLTFAISDLSANWESYRRRYEQWLEK